MSFETCGRPLAEDRRLGVTARVPASSLLRCNTCGKGCPTPGCPRGWCASGSRFSGAPPGRFGFLIEQVFEEFADLEADRVPVFDEIHGVNFGQSVRNHVRTLFTLSRLTLTAPPCTCAPVRFLPCETFPDSWRRSAALLGIGLQDDAYFDIDAVFEGQLLQHRGVYLLGNPGIALVSICPPAITFW